MTSDGSIEERLRVETDPAAPPCEFDTALARFLLTYVRTKQTHGGALGADSNDDGLDAAP